MKINKKYLILLVVFAIAFCLPHLAEAQCAMCQANVKTAMMNEKGKAIGTGLNNGILFLLASPYVLIGTALIIWRRNAKKQELSIQDAS